MAKPKRVLPPLEEDDENELLDSLEHGASTSEMERRVAVAREKLREMMASPTPERARPNGPRPD